MTTVVPDSNKTIVEEEKKEEEIGSPDAIMNDRDSQYNKTSQLNVLAVEESPDNVKDELIDKINGQTETIAS